MKILCLIRKIHFPSSELQLSGKRGLEVFAPPQSRQDRRPDKKSLNKQIPISISKFLSVDFAFATRPEFELYDLKRDPDQVENVASNSEYAKVLQELTNRLMTTLRETEDPRVTGDGKTFDEKPFVDPTFPPKQWVKKELKF